MYVTNFRTIPEKVSSSLFACSAFSQRDDEAGGSYRWTQEFSADIRAAEKSSKYVFRFCTDGSQTACVYDSINQRFDVKRRVRVSFCLLVAFLICWSRFAFFLPPIVISSFSFVCTGARLGHWRRLTCSAQWSWPGFTFRSTYNLVFCLEPTSRSRYERHRVWRGRINERWKI